MIGDGSIEWNSLAANLRKAKYDGIINFEVFRSPKYNDADIFINTLKERVAQFFN